MNTISPMPEENITKVDAFLGDYGVGRIGNAVFTKGNPNSTIWIYCHIDTKSEGDILKWKSDPFELKLVQNKIIGLGVSDAKFQLLNVLLLDHENIYLIIDGEEECGGTEVSRCFSSMGGETTLIVVDGYYGGDYRFYSGTSGQLDGVLHLNTGNPRVHPARASSSAMPELISLFFKTMDSFRFKFTLTGISAETSVRSLSLEKVNIRFDIRYNIGQVQELSDFIKMYTPEIKQWMLPLQGVCAFRNDGIDKFSEKPALFSNQLASIGVNAKRVIVAPGAIPENGNHQPNEFIYAYQIKEHQKCLNYLLKILKK